MSRSGDLGALGEAIAALYLQACGYSAVERRYRRPAGEIDLIVRRADLVVFVEVKTRGPGAPAAPQAWVDARKLRRLRRTAAEWIARQPGPPAGAYRFDVIAVRLQQGQQGLLLRHFQGVA